MEEETFLAKMVLGGRITVPYEVRERLGLKKGDFMKVKIRKDEKVTE